MQSITKNPDDDPLLPLVLVLGIDGGFGVRGSGAELDARRWLAANTSVALVYVSGRTVESARAFIEVLKLPAPHVLIADSGASVVPGRLAADFSLLEADLQRGWMGPTAVRDQLSDLDPWIEPQPWRASRRVPFFIRSGVRATDAVGRVREALRDVPVTVLCSDDVYLDVVPQGVSRPATLDRLRLWAGWQHRRLVVATAAAADLSLLDRADRRIVLPDADLRILETMANQSRVFAAQRQGFHGVVDGLRHWLREG